MTPDDATGFAQAAFGIASGPHRPAVQHVTDGQNRAILIDGSQPEGRAALARWSHIPDEERAKWAKPADTRTLEQVSADIDAAFGWRASK